MKATFLHLILTIMLYAKAPLGLYHLPQDLRIMQSHLLSRLQSSQEPVTVVTDVLAWSKLRKNLMKRDGVTKLYIRKKILFTYDEKKAALSKHIRMNVTDSKLPTLIKVDTELWIFSLPLEWDLLEKRESEVSIVLSDPTINRRLKKAVLRAEPYLK